MTRKGRELVLLCRHARLFLEHAREKESHGDGQARFATLWADVRVQPCATATYEVHHPLIGTLSVTQQTLRLVDQPDQTLVTHTTAADTNSADALKLLADLTREQHPAATVGAAVDARRPAAIQ